MISKKIFLLSILFFALFNARFAEADSVGIGVDQSVFAFSGDPGSTQKITVTVKNISNDEQKMSAVPKDFVVGDNNKIESITQNNEQFGMKDWVKTDEQNWILKPGETKEILFNVSIPEKATVGAHYSIIDIRAFPQIDGQNFQDMIVGGQVGVYLLLNVNGSAWGSGEVRRFDAPVVMKKTNAFKVNYENTGNILYIPHGEVEVQNIISKKKTFVESEKHFVFPGKKYSFEMDWNAGSVFGAYKAQAVFADANGKAHSERRFMFGKLFFIFPIVLFGILTYLTVKVSKNRKRKRVINIENIC